MRRRARLREYGFVAVVDVLVGDDDYDHDDGDDDSRRR